MSIIIIIIFPPLESFLLIYIITRKPIETLVKLSNPRSKEKRIHLSREKPTGFSGLMIFQENKKKISRKQSRLKKLDWLLKIIRENIFTVYWIYFFFKVAIFINWSFLVRRRMFGFYRDENHVFLSIVSKGLAIAIDPLT